MLGRPAPQGRLAPVDFTRILLDPLKQPLGLFLRHLTGRWFGLLILLLVLVLVLLLVLVLAFFLVLWLLVLLPVLILLLLVLLAFVPVLRLRVLIRLLKLLLEGQFEIVLVVDLSRIDAEGLFVRFGAFLEPLLAVEAVPQVVPGGCGKGRVARLDRPVVCIQGPDVLFRLVERVPIVEESERASRAPLEGPPDIFRAPRGSDPLRRGGCRR